MENEYLSLTRRDDQVCVVELRGPGKVSTLGQGMLQALEGLADELEALDDCPGVVFVGSKPAGFLAGADLKEFLSSWAGKTPAEVRKVTEEVIGRCQTVFNRIEDLRFPTVAAIHGAALGGGYELALACDARVAADAPSTVVGLPEVNLGLIPAAGGTQRLTRLIGMAGALKNILGGSRLNARRALKQGLVDRVVPPASLVAQSVALLGDLRAKKVKLKRNPRRGFAVRMMEAVGMGRDVIESRAMAEVQKKTRGHYPAPIEAGKLVAFAADRGDLTEGLRREREAIGELAAGKVATNLIEVFFMMEGGKNRPAPGGGEPREVQRVGVVGAGFMGAGVAQLAAAKGMKVYLKDRDDEGLGRGMKTCAGLFKKLEKIGKLGPGGVRAAMGRIQPVLEDADLAKSDLVVEAVFEDVELKQKVLSAVEAAVRDDAVIATNTSGIPLAEITPALEDPSRFVGMHFFSPVHKMPLLEVIRGAESSPEAVATVVKVGQRMGKSVVVVKDGPGFFTTRVLGIYLCEVFKALMDGGEVDALDKAFEEFGWPVGPFKLMDEVGIDVGAKVSKGLRKAFPDRVADPAALVALLDKGRRGRKAGKGFYKYGKDGASTGEVDPGVYKDLVGRKPGGGASPRKVVDQVMAVLVDECVRCLDEGVIETAHDGDTAMVLGLGFPPFRGGLFRWVDGEGPARFVELLKKSDREPCARLVEMVDDDARFYDEAGR